MSNIPNCPKCDSEYTYEDGNLYICPECTYEWMKYQEERKSNASVVKDAYGNALEDGDSVTIIKDIKVKGSSQPIKIGLKIKEIRLIQEVNGHNIEAKVKGFGQMRLKSEVVKKSN